MDRLVEPEILDELESNDPRALRARRDLRRINFWMGHAGLMARALRDSFPARPPQRIVEIGAGDGSLLLRVAAQRPWQQAPLEIWMIDREPAIADETVDQYRAFGWKVRVVVADIFEWMEIHEPSDCILANLILHHFSSDQLRFLFDHAAAQTRCLIAGEPSRSRHALFSCQLLPLIGIGDVALHDAAVSVRAGFWGRELSGCWPDRTWQLREGRAGLFSHRFVAQKP